VEQVGRSDEQVAGRAGGGRGDAHAPVDWRDVSVQSITGEISLLWEDVDPYAGDVILMSLDPDEPMSMNTFEIRGPLAVRLKDGALREGVRVRVECRAETVEVVNLDNGETSDEDRAVVLDVVVLGE
jgi:hypothetical protein